MFLQVLLSFSKSVTKPKRDLSKDEYISNAPSRECNFGNYLRLSGIDDESLAAVKVLLHSYNTSSQSKY